MKIVRILAVVAVLAGVAVAVGLNLGPKEPVSIQVQTERARVEPITQVVTATGKIRPERQVQVAADVGGYIRQLSVKEGDSVQAGQLLAQIDPEIYAARVLEGQAAEKTAQAQLTLAGATLERVRGEVERVRGLFAKDLTSRSALEKAQADLAIAEAQVEGARGQLLQAQAALDRARKDLKKCTITSPLAGTVVALNKEAGERASGGDFREDILMTVADLSSMEVNVEVGERDVVLISAGDEVEIDADAFPGQTIAGRVKEIGNAGITKNPGTEAEVTNFRVVIQVGESALGIRPEMSATVRIRVDHKAEALTVPIQSVGLRRPSELEEQEPVPGEEADPTPPRDAARAGGQREEPVEIVFVVEGGRALARRVKTGLSSDARIEILQGLEADAEVVTGPYRALAKDLQSGALVRGTEPIGGPGRGPGTGAGRPMPGKKLGGGGRGKG
jgi:HlyD family secretion protein